MTAARRAVGAGANGEAPVPHRAAPGAELQPAHSPRRVRAAPGYARARARSGSRQGCGRGPERAGQALAQPGKPLAPRWIARAADARRDPRQQPLRRLGIGRCHAAGSSAANPAGCSATARPISASSARFARDALMTAETDRRRELLRIGNQGDGFGTPRRTAGVPGCGSRRRRARSKMGSALLGSRRKGWPSAASSAASRARGTDSSGRTRRQPGSSRTADMPARPSAPLPARRRIR